MEPFDSSRADLRADLREGADLTGAGRFGDSPGDRLTGSNRLDRFRARSVAAGPQRSPGRPVAPWIAAAVLLAFALGMIANPWFERSVRGALPGFAPTIAPTVADVAALQARVAALENRAARAPAAVVVPGGTPAQGERLARVEATLDNLAASEPAATTRTDRLAADLAALSGRIDATTAATAAALASATANAERAQAMVVLGAAHRQIDAGARLGALEPALRRAFGARAPQAVEAVAALGATPVTLAGLRTALDRLRPELTGAAAAATSPRGWWAGLKDSLSFIVVRPASGSGNDPAARVDRAARALAAGNAAAAAAEVAALPPALRAKAQNWLAAAERYQAGMRGLGDLDTTMLEPLPAVPLLPATSPPPAPVRSPVPAA